MDRRLQPQGESLTRSRATLPVSPRPRVPASGYSELVSDISGLLEQARRTAARSVNSILTAAYWEIGRRIVEYEQKGRARAEYGEKLLIHLSTDLTTKYGRGFSQRNLRQMRAFYLGWEIWQTPSAKLEARAKIQTLESLSNHVQAKGATPEDRQATFFGLKDAETR